MSADARARMVEWQLRRRGIDDERVLAAMGRVPRELFLPPELREAAYADAALPIGGEQTISQPYMVALICEQLALQGGERVLDVGTGSGYHAAVLARLAAHVFSIERHPALSERAGRVLEAAGVRNVTLAVGDGCAGLPEHAPYEAINVAAAAAGEVPRALGEQLARGGRMVAPIENGEQRLVLLWRGRRGLQAIRLERVRFVPLVSGPA